MFKKYVLDKSYILEHELIELHEDLSYEEKLLQILDRKIKTLRNKEISLVQIVLWRNQKTEEVMWEREEEMRTFHLELF